MASVAAVFALLDLAGVGTTRDAIVIEAVASLALAACALLAALLSRSLAALTVLSVIGPSIALVATALVVRTSGASPPAPLLVAVVTAGVMGFVHLSFAAAVAVAVVACTAQLLSGSHSVFAAVVVVACSGAGLLAARIRHKRAIEQFLKVERLTAALKRLRALQDQLVVVEKLEALRVLVGGMAHELNNALAISLASTQQAMKELPESAAAARAALGRSDGGLQRIKRTVDRLRRFAMAEGSILEPADVAAMLDFALESAIGRARSGVIIERDYDPAVGSIEIHVAALAEALFQIAKNAVEAMPGGGTIHARVRREGEKVVLAVSDEGKGIPPEEIMRVFDPFYTRAKGHVGFGLSTVYGLVTSLGGRVEIDSEVGKGTEVSIILPARKASIRPPAPEKPQSM
jgi:signal transduction histidine kinase